MISLITAMVHGVLKLRAFTVSLLLTGEAVGLLAKSSAVSWVPAFSQANISSTNNSLQFSRGVRSGLKIVGELVTGK